MDTRNARELAIPHRFIDERSLLGFGLVGGVLLFVVLSGCAVWLLPFSVFGQLCLVLHTVVGVIAVAAFPIWQLSHWLAGRTSPRTFRKICAYVGFWLFAASAATPATSRARTALIGGFSMCGSLRASWWRGRYQRAPRVRQCSRWSPSRPVGQA